MSEGANGGGKVKKVVGYIVLYTVAIMALGLWITFTFGADKRPAAGFVYVFHALFYSACLGSLLGLMFHAAEEH
jgi:hypothetical protein